MKVTITFEAEIEPAQDCKFTNKQITEHWFYNTFSNITHEIFDMNTDEKIGEIIMGESDEIMYHIEEE